jgi:hypothetical protein
MDRIVSGLWNSIARQKNRHLGACAWRKDAYVPPFPIQDRGFIAACDLRHVLLQQSLRNHPDYEGGYFDALLGDFPADPVIHLG